MPLSWNEIKSRAIAFSKDWSAETSERAEAQSFWNAFFHVFGIERRRVASFEQQVAIARAGHKLKHGRIDGFWKGTLLIEHKSAGQSLDRAFAQAVDYFEGLPERDLPRYVLVSDFTRLRLADFETDAETEFALKDLHKHIKRFGFIAGYQAQQIKPQDPVNIRAAEQMGKLHDALKASCYEGHPLEVLLVRLLFCLFADDTGIFQPSHAFRAWVEERTVEDGADLGPQLALLFQALNTPEDKRSLALDEQVRAFPYVNGELFREALPLAAFTRAMRESLLDACAIDWSTISPAIFGALFQSIMDTKARRNLGAHYTSEENILKLIKPLSLDDLWAAFHRIKGNRNRLFEFHKRLRTLNFLDPACGCGNFLVITYRELRLLELELLRAPYSDGQQLLDIHQRLSLDVDQFHGIEIEEFPAQIAQVALWLVDHQMNVLAGEEFGLYFARIPLRATPHIVNGNALRLEWEHVLPASKCSYVLGNPPFSGSKLLGGQQRADADFVFGAIAGAGLLDFVAAWYVKATHFMHNADAARSLPRCAFVPTNSITQGEQVVLLWGWLLAQGVKIHFAHRTFQWSNEARGVAAVHCVIIGFGLDDRKDKTIFEYDDIRGEPHAVPAARINPYLVGRAAYLVGEPALPSDRFPSAHDHRRQRFADRPWRHGLRIWCLVERHAHRLGANHGGSTQKRHPLFDEVHIQHLSLARIYHRQTARTDRSRGPVRARHPRPVSRLDTRRSVRSADDAARAAEGAPQARCGRGRGLWQEDLQERRRARGLPVRAVSAVHLVAAGRARQEGGAATKARGEGACSYLSKRRSPERDTENSAGAGVWVASRRIAGHALMMIAAVSAAERLPEVSANMCTPASRTARSSLGRRRMFLSRVTTNQPRRPTSAIHSGSGALGWNMSRCATKGMPALRSSRSSR